MRRHLGEFEQVLLYAVLHLQNTDTGACGPTIGETVHARTGRVLSPGAIYTGLGRLERRGFVSSELGDPTPERGGKRKRFYRLRAAGAAALRSAASTLGRMSTLAQRPTP